MFGLSTKAIILIVVITTITATVGGFFMYQKSIVSDLNEKITSLQKDNTELTTKVTGLEISLASTESQLAAAKVEHQDVLDELVTTKILRDKVQEKNNEYENLFKDQEREKKLARLIKSRGVSLLLRKMDNSVSCEIDHFDEIDGKCIEGQWVPTGERLVPLGEGQ